MSLRNQKRMLCCAAVAKPYILERETPTPNKTTPERSERYRTTGRRRTEGPQPTRTCKRTFPRQNSLQGQSPVGLLNIDKLRISADFQHFVVILFHGCHIVVANFLFPENNKNNDISFDPKSGKHVQIPPCVCTCLYTNLE